MNLEKIDSRSKIDIGDKVVRRSDTDTIIEVDEYVLNSVKRQSMFWLKVVD